MDACRQGTFSPLFIGVTVVTTEIWDAGTFVVQAFSPLFIGVTVVTQIRGRYEPALTPFSPLFIGVTVVTPARAGELVELRIIFQSPFHRGNGCNDVTAGAVRGVWCAFSPLFIGVTVVTAIFTHSFIRLCKSFSPLFIGVTVVTKTILRTYRVVDSFQSPFHRGNGCNCALQIG